MLNNEHYTPFKKMKSLVDRSGMSIDTRTKTNDAYYVLAVVALLGVWACTIVMRKR